MAASAFFSLLVLDASENKTNLVRMEGVMRNFGYKLAGYFMEYGPIPAADLEEAKQQIRGRLGVRRLPGGIQIWDLSERPLARWKVARAG